jgi:hypothetical protein
MKTRRKTKKILKLEAEFDTRLRELLTTRFGAGTNTVHLAGMYELALETEVGPLLVEPNGSWAAMRFVDVERAKTRLPHRLMEGPLNPFSGKYNSMIFDDDLPVQARLDIVQNMIEQVTA